MYKVDITLTVLCVYILCFFSPSLSVTQWKSNIIAEIHYLLLAFKIQKIHYLLAAVGILIYLIYLPFPTWQLKCEHIYSSLESIANISKCASLTLQFFTTHVKNTLIGKQ